MNHFGLLRIQMKIGAESFEFDPRVAAAAVFTYLLLSVNVDWILVVIEVPGIVVGSIIGPMINRRINERYLRLFVAIVLVCIGVYYLL